MAIAAHRETIPRRRRRTAPVGPAHRAPLRASWAWARIGVLVFIPTMAAAAIYVGRLHLFGIGLISVYGGLSMIRVAAQSIGAAIVRRRRYVLTGDHPMVSIVVAVWNENADDFDRAIASLTRQNYGRYEVIVVDDGSDPHHAEEHEATCDYYGARYLYQEHAGKREALYLAFEHADRGSKYILTGDSDTVWEDNATWHLVALLESSPRIGAVTGHVDTLNADETWLTVLTSLRYWIAFQIERAAQSYRGTVTCVSGPLGGYRRDVIDRIKDRFVAQTFLGRVCTFGDDRHLTNLVLDEGYQVHYTSAAVAWTVVPERLRKYLKQQARWGRSHWREMLWTWKAMSKHSVLLAADWTMTLVLPFLLVLSAGWYIGTALTGHPGHLLTFLGVVVGMSLVRAAPALIATRDPRFLWLPAFALFHLAVLLPLKFLSLATVARGGWGTRAAVLTDPADQVDTVVFATVGDR